jgi:hypothetical protein
LQALDRHQLTTEVWYSCKDDLLIADQKGIQTGGELRRYLLGVRPVALEYFAQAAQLSTSNIVQLLSFIEPDMVRAWFSMPELNWSSGDALRQWAEQSLLQYAGNQDQHDLTSVLDQLGRTIFPDAPIVRQYAKTALNDATSDLEERKTIEQLLSFAETQSSLALKANVVLALCEWLCRHEEQSLPPNCSWDEVGERFLALTTCVLQGFTTDDSRQAMAIALETTICRWLYHSWVVLELHGGDHVYELAYIASVCASHIVDALVVDGQITQQVAQGVVNTLGTDLKHKMIVEGVEPQPDGVYRPTWGIYLNYAASFLLKGLLAGDFSMLELCLTPAVKAAALACGVRHRREQAFCSPVFPDPSWLDAELVADIGAACVDFLSKLSESEQEAWSEQERKLLQFAASPGSSVSACQTLITSIPKIDDEQMVMQLVLWLFQGRAQSRVAWFDLLRHLFDSEVMNHLRQFETCYGEVMWRLGELLMHPSENCPSDVLVLSRDLLFEVPVGEKAPALLRIKAHVLSQLVDLGLDVASVCQWLKNVVQSDKIDISIIRSVLRPFILFWPRYAKETRDTLFATLMEVAQRPGDENLWEFARLARHRKFYVADEASNANSQ